MKNKKQKNLPSIFLTFVQRKILVLANGGVFFFFNGG